MIATLLLPFLLLFQVTPTAAQVPTRIETPRSADTASKPAETQRPPEVKEEPPIGTKHSVRVGQRQFNYTVTTGFIPLKHAVSGDVEARIF